jgi:Fe-S cluster biogenesis protein NfuA
LWIGVVGLILVGGMAGAARVDAASLTLDWAAPTTNADGTQLTDLGSYRIYLGASSPACPSASFFTVASPTSSPANGETLSRVVASLTADTEYVARITAVDTSGNESACSAEARGVANADFSVTPSTTTSFGTVAVGTTVDRTFTVQNTSTISLSGTVSIGAPYSIQTGGSFSLAAGASQTVTVRFRPTSSGTFAGNVNFVAGTDTISRAVTGAGTDSSTSSTPATYTLSVTKNGSGSGMVTDTGTPARINCGADCSESVTAGTALTLTATPATGSTFAGWSGACSGTGSCAITVNAATTVTATFNTTLTPVTTTLTPVTLSVTKSGPGTITSAPAGIINCGATCSQSVTPGTVLTLTADPASGSSFVGWKGACAGTGSCTLTISTDTTVTATFKRQSGRWKSQP